MKNNAVLYFVKFPRAGHVKTRLAQTVGPQEAARIYRKLAQANFNVIRKAQGVDLIVTFDPPDHEEEIKQWLPGCPAYLSQYGDNLGKRLNHAFEWAFDSGYQRVTAVGSDVLGLRPIIVEQSFMVLKEADAVIGPAKDGGYYLIGLSSKEPKLFEGINWSTSNVLSQTYQIINTLALKYHTLCPLEDLDELKPGGTHEFIHS